MNQPRTHTYQYGNVEIVVTRPVLNEKEQHKRESTLRRALTEYGKAVVKREQEGGRTA